MQLSEPLALAIVRARDRARDALRYLATQTEDAYPNVTATFLYALTAILQDLPVITEADRVVAEMVTDERAVNGDESPNQPLP